MAWARSICLEDFLSHVKSTKCWIVQACGCWTKFTTILWFQYCCSICCLSQRREQPLIWLIAGPFSHKARERNRERAKERERSKERALIQTHRPPLGHICTAACDMQLYKSLKTCFCYSAVGFHFYEEIQYSREKTQCAVRVINHMQPCLQTLTLLKLL